FNAVGDWVDDPTDPFDYNNVMQGIWWVLFDPRTAVGGVTQTISVGIATKNPPRIYPSNDAGATCSAVTGQPTTECGGTGIMPTKATLAPSNAFLSVPYGTNAGLYADGQ